MCACEACQWLSLQGSRFTSSVSPAPLYTSLWQDTNDCHSLRDFPSAQAARLYMPRAMEAKGRLSLQGSRFTSFVGPFQHECTHNSVKVGFALHVACELDCCKLWVALHIQPPRRADGNVPGARNRLPLTHPRIKALASGAASS